MLPAPESDAHDGEGPETTGRTSGRLSRPPLLIALVVLLTLEGLLVAAAAVWLLIELLTVRPDSYASAVAILVLVVLATIWVLATALGAFRAQGWSRASAVTVQVLQLAVAVGCFQGLYAEPALGWTLLIPAVAGILLALSPQVVRATARNTEQHE